MTTNEIQMSFDIIKIVVVISCLFIMYQMSGD